MVPLQINIAAWKQMKVSGSQHWFPDPKWPSAKVCVIFDDSHMVKLMWNLLKDKKTICHNQNGQLQEIVFVSDKQTKNKTHSMAET